MGQQLRANGLGLFFGGLVLLTLAAQALAGAAEFNDQQTAEGLDQLSVAQYVLTADFTADVAENWQSEYLQFVVFILATVWLVQRGSPESKELDAAGPDSDDRAFDGQQEPRDPPAWARAHDWRRRLYSHSLALTMGSIFLLSWLAQYIAGWSTYNEDQLRNRQPVVSLREYLFAPDFWSRTTQNWQSEFLAVGSMVVLSIYLRERGSPESKPVSASHDDTAETG